MSRQDENNGLGFKNHKIDLCIFEWGMNKRDVSRSLDIQNHGENKNVIGYTVQDGLEFDGNRYDAVLLFYFDGNKMNTIR